MMEFHEIFFVTSEFDVHRNVGIPVLRVVGNVITVSPIESE